MALKRLTTDEMIQVSGAWVAGGAAHATLVAQAELAGLVPLLAAARAALVALQAPVTDPKLAALSAEAAEVDLRHDDLVRGVHGLFTALVLLAGSGPVADRLTGARDKLFPEALEMVQKTYRAEAGATERAGARLAGDAALGALLDETMANGQPLRAYVKEWLLAGRRLGEIEAARGMVVPAPPVGPQEVEARNAWIRVVNALVANAALCVEGEADALLFGALRLAEETAGRRGGKAAAPAQEPAKPA